MSFDLAAEVERAERREARKVRYVGKLLPIGRLAEVPDVHGERSVEQFTRWTFAYQADRLDEAPPPVLIDHDDNRRIGRVTKLWSDDCWWRAEIQLDDTDYGHFARTQLLRMVGIPPFRDPSLSACYTVKRSTPLGQIPNSHCVEIATLHEVSLAVRGVSIYRDAAVVSTKLAEREELRPVPGLGPETAAAASASTLGAGGPRVYRRDCGTILSIR